MPPFCTLVAIGCLTLLTLVPVKGAEVGDATYMSSELSGLTTASGDKFWPWYHTAASWKHFGKEVLVINVANGRQTRVLVNDKGPARRIMKTGVVIDLSKAAYNLIATPQDRLRGRMKVVVQPLPLDVEPGLYPLKTRVRLAK